MRKENSTKDKISQEVMEIWKCLNIMDEMATSIMGSMKENSNMMRMRMMESKYIKVTEPCTQADDKDFYEFKINRLRMRIGKIVYIF